MIADVAIIGGGSAGVGAAYRLQKAGNIKVILIERNAGLGGVSVFGGVNCWEPGIGGPGIHSTLARRLLSQPGAACVGKSTDFPNSKIRWGLSRSCESPYEATCLRAGVSKTQWRRFHFEPDAMCQAMRGLFHQDSIQFLFGAQLETVERRDRRICSVGIRKENGEMLRVLACLYLDCSGDIALARQTGCGYWFGEDSAGRFGEPSAPEKASNTVNAPSLIFRVSKSNAPAYQNDLSEDLEAPVRQWMQKTVETENLVSAINEYPNGDLNVNMLPTMESTEFFRLGYQKAMEICQARVWRYWEWMRREKGFGDYRIQSIFPMMGIRESWRLSGVYTLTEQDVRAGLGNQRHADRVIALADHALDTHGRTKIQGARCPELLRPYGILYDCMLPVEVDNLLVACRGSSFSHIAASSARLSRTMLSLGEAAGEAAAWCCRMRQDFPQANLSHLRSVLQLPQMEEALFTRFDM